MAKIILLNGTSSAGKSTLARAIQNAARQPMLRVQMDAFLEMLPPRYANHADAFQFSQTADQDVPEIEIVTGPYGAKLMRALRMSIAAIASEGLSAIVDTVLLENDIDHYRSALSVYDFYVVKVACALDVAETREAARGDRLVGQVRWQYPRVHRGVEYGLVVDTSKHTAAGCADLIQKKFDL